MFLEQNITEHHRDLQMNTVNQTITKCTSRREQRLLNLVNVEANEQLGTTNFAENTPEEETN